MEARIVRLVRDVKQNHADEKQLQKRFIALGEIGRNGASVPPLAEKVDLGSVFGASSSQVTPQTWNGFMNQTSVSGKCQRKCKVDGSGRWLWLLHVVL